MEYFDFSPLSINGNLSANGFVSSFLSEKYMLKEKIMPPPQQFSLINDTKKEGKKREPFISSVSFLFPFFTSQP